jgi:DNA-binding GntR family transcriptional regulator
MSGNGSVPSDPIYQRLRRLIVEGHYAPGARLVEERLAEEMKVSRTPVRQALARVAAEGLVRIYPNRGAVVRSFGVDDLVHAYELRALLEGHAAFRAASRISAAQLDTLEQAQRALEAALERSFDSREDEIHYLVEHNQIFHATIVAASGNDRIADLLPTVVDVPLQYRSFYWYTPDERRVSNFFHRSILVALRAGDADRARAVMHEHVLYGRDALLSSIDK